MSHDFFFQLSLESVGKGFFKFYHDQNNFIYCTSFSLDLLKIKVRENFQMNWVILTGMTGYCSVQNILKA